MGCNQGFYTQFQVPTIRVLGTTVAKWTGTQFICGDNPEGSGAELRLVPTAATTVAGSVDVIGRNGNGETIRARWFNLQLPSGSPITASIPPAYVALDSAPTVPLLRTDERRRRIVSFDALTTNLNTAFKITTDFDQLFRAVQSADLSDEPNFVIKPDANSNPSESGQGQGNTTFSIQIIDVSLPIRAILQGRYRSYKTEPISTRQQVTTVAFSGTIVTGDSFSVVIDGVPFTTTANTTPTAAGTALAGLITTGLSTIPSVTSVAAVNGVVTITSVAGRGFDANAYFTSANGLVQVQLVQDTDYEYEVRDTSLRPILALVVTERGNQDGVQRIEVFPKVKPTTIGRSASLQNYTTTDIEFQAYLNADGKLSKVFEGS
jgi:hypothetical protein